MAILFILLLFLDFLSLRFPRVDVEPRMPTLHSAVFSTTKTAVAHAQPSVPWTPTIPFEAKNLQEESEDACGEATRREVEHAAPEVRRFVDPVMSLLEAPCMFCLKHM